MKHFLLSSLSAVLISLSTVGCSGKSAINVTNVDKDITVALYETETKDGILCLVSPALLEETVHVSEFVHYAENGDSVTIPFHFSDVEKYAEITEKNIEKKIAISINGKIVATPTVKMRLDNGACSVLLPQEQISELFL